MSASRLVFVHAWTPLHAGTGQGVGSIDLPIARERATNLPFAPGSSLKGCLRDAARASGEANLAAIFGTETELADKADAHAGALRVGDARLTLFPVRSLTATFVWVTCPFVLRRLTRDAEACGWKGLPAVPAVANDEARVTAGTATIQLGTEKRLVLEEVDFKVAKDAETQWATWFASQIFGAEVAWQDELKKRFAIISDDVFTFLTEFATEVNAHIRIKESTGTVEDGALWYQECLPAESMLVSVFQADHSRKKGDILKAEDVIKKALAPESVQLGGKATTGLGVVRLVAAIPQLAGGGVAR